MIAVLCIYQLVCSFMYSDIVCYLLADFSIISILLLRPIVCTAPSDPVLYTCLSFARPVSGRKSLSAHLAWMAGCGSCGRVVT